MSASPNIPRRYRRALQYVLAGMFVLALLGITQVSGDWWQAVAATVGFATAIAVIAAACVGWEDEVASAETAGLVKHSS